MRLLQRHITTIIAIACATLLISAAAQDRRPVRRPHTPSAITVDTTGVALTDSLFIAATDSVTASLKAPSPYDIWEETAETFNPDPTRAVWMAALFPGLGQVYNRRYWKLPIVVGAYLGLGYATSWNNGMLSDYTKAYRDIMDNDPSTNSYMNFFPPTTQESDLDKQWLTNLLQSRKNFYRRNRDLCIICMVGVYLVAMVDAYVDASLSHFDISPDLSMDIAPAIMQDGRNTLPSLGLAWVLNF
ncbi:MAG: DUF5683 domain-containing protein [Odoribacter sp.]|nr:DUF5683 domain-containing protein [Odoribacter sp.]